MPKIFDMVSDRISTAEYPETDLINPVTPFDVPSYLGLWHEVARLPTPYQENMRNVTATYALDEKGRLRILNRGFEKGEERVAEGYGKQEKENTGLFKVSFMRPFYGLYKIILLAEDYSSAVVCSSRKNRLWILSRQPHLYGGTLAYYLTRLEHWSFDIDALIYSSDSDR